MAFTIGVTKGRWSEEVLALLLQDHITQENIIWATDDYRDYGSKFTAVSSMQLPFLISADAPYNSISDL